MRMNPIMRITWLLWACIFFVSAACHDSSSTAPPPDETPVPDTSALTVSSPVRLSLTTEGELVVSDAYQEAIHVVDQDTLAVLSSVRLDGEPSGVAVFGDDFLVGNLSNQSVEQYSREGGLLSTFAEGVTVPASIAVDGGAERVFVLDSSAKTVRVYDFSGVPLGNIPAEGQLLLDTPTAITVDVASQSLWISDYGPFNPDNGFFSFGTNDTFVHEYGYDGIYQRTLSGNFSRPQGLDVVGSEIFITDCVLGQVLVFDLASLTQSRTIGSPGKEPGELLFPLDVLVSATSGDAYVANNQAGRIERFQGVLP